MGREKAFLPVRERGPESLLPRQIELLHELGLSEILVSIRRDMTCADPRPTVVHDATEGLGPMGGIVEAMRLAPDRHLLVLAVDLAFVDAPLLRSLLTCTSGTSGAAPRVSGQWEPLCTIYPPHTLSKAEAVLVGETRAPSALVSQLAAEGVMNSVRMNTAEQAQLRSWNRPEDLPAAVRRRLEVES